MFKSCGLLSARELEITDAEDAMTILERIRSKEWSAKEVTIAFCKRATIAHQMINCLMDCDFEGAIKRASELDDHLAKTGKVVGPLHGLPVSLKVRSHLFCFVKDPTTKGSQDLTAVKGMRYSIGFAVWGECKSDNDALMVQTLRKAGAVVYVKTTMPQTGMV